MPSHFLEKFEDKYSESSKYFKLISDLFVKLTTPGTQKELPCNVNKLDSKDTGATLGNCTNSTQKKNVRKIIEDLLNDDDFEGDRLYFFVKTNDENTVAYKNYLEKEREEREREKMGPRAVAEAPTEAPAEADAPAAESAVAEASAPAEAQAVKPESLNAVRNKNLTDSTPVKNLDGFNFNTFLIKTVFTDGDDEFHLVAKNC